MSDWNLIGHAWAVRRLQQSIETGQVAQSHLFAGPQSVGKATLALAFARALLSRDTADPARAASLVDRLKHPDLFWIEPEAGESSIKVEQARALLHALTLSPVESRFRVAVINDAHLVTDGAQNAILKTLEEPNPAAVIVLIAPQPGALLPTIVSRCQTLNLRPAPATEIEQALLARGAEPGKARLLARLARGRPGWALRALTDGELLAAREQRLADLRAALAANRTNRFAFAETMSKAGPQAARSVLEEWLWYWRDVARAACDPAGEPLADALLNIDCAQSIAEVARRVSPAGAARATQAILRAMSALEQNANPRLTFDALLLQLPSV